MLDGLPDRFNAVVTAWSVVPERDQTRLTLKRMLLEAEARSTVTAEIEQALAAFSKMAVKNSTKPGKDKKNKKDIECFKCHKKGHFARDCRYSFQKKNFDGSKSKKSNEESTSKKSADGSSNSTGSSCFIVGSSESPEHSWIADSGASCHMVNDRSWFSDFISTESTLRLAGKGSLTAIGVGKVPIEKCVNGQWELAYLLNVLYVPGLRKNLFSVGAAARRGVTSYVYNGYMEFKRNGRLELEAVQADNNMFTLAIRKPINVEANVVTDLKIWHDRLGHVSLKCIREMIATEMMPALKIDTDTQLFCESCIYGKMSKLPFEECERRAFAVGEMWHSDVNTMPVKSWGGHRYYVIFVDDKTGFRYVHFMKHKDEVLKNFIDMVKRVEIATGHKVKVLRSDNGGEYKNAKFKAFTTEKGIDHQFSAPHTPEQNGVAERDNRTVMEKALSMLLAKQMPKEACGPLDIDQHKKWPTEEINIPNEDESEENMQHPDDVQHPEEDVQHPEEDVQHPEEDVQHSEEDEEDVQHSEENEQYSEENVRRQLRDRAKLRQPDFYQCTVCCTELDEPQTYEEAMASNEVEQWRRAIEEEESALIKNNTWTKTKLPTGRKAITAKIIFKKKRDADGKVHRYKARLVVRGFSQRPGIDYNETYAPVIRYESIRFLFSLAAKEDFEIAQFDIKTAFLNGELDEEIFMQLPTRVTDAGNVVKLQKSLYGLKQSPRQWNKRFHQFLCKFNFISSEADRCVYKGNIEGERVLLALYVDDGLVMAKTQQAVEMKNYLLRVAKRFNMEDAKGISTPMEAGKYLVINNNDTSAGMNVPYREAVGSLMFAACVTRPDIMFAVAVVSRYLEQSATEHWTAVKRIIRYAKETADYGIVYDGATAEPLVIYSDSDFAADPDTRRSTSGYVTVHCGGPISWQSIRQKIVALSTTEAEYVAASDATKEAIWIRRLMKSVGAAAVGHATELRLDNQGSIKLIKNPEFHKRTKHIDVRFHFIRDIYSK
ncbi:retrovirus-related pol polyprotein from transposon tnt 1-94, partial [Lasius niger]